MNEWPRPLNVRPRTSGSLVISLHPNSPCEPSTCATASALCREPSAAARRGYPGTGRGSADGPNCWRPTGASCAKHYHASTFIRALQQLVSELEPGKPSREPAAATPQLEPVTVSSTGPWRLHTTWSIRTRDWSRVSFNRQFGRLRATQGNLTGATGIE